MPVPTYDRFIEPLFRYLSQCPNGASASDAYAVMANIFGLTKSDCAELLPSGTQATYKNRIGWAHDCLKRAGYSSSPKRGQWQLTNEGQAYIAKHLEPLTTEQILELAKPKASIRLQPADTETESYNEASDLSSNELDKAVSPVERLEVALKEIDEIVKIELLEIIGQSSPYFFEILVLDLLNAMGYGTSRRDIQHVGGSGDSGIDGIISLDRLGLEKVYVQAKRWINTVGRPEVQGFYGALAGHRASKGVFITTSKFTRQATDFAQSLEGLILVDGSRLTALMIEYGIGTSHRILKVPKVDSDYFEE